MVSSGRYSSLDDASLPIELQTLKNELKSVRAALATSQKALNLTPKLYTRSTKSVEEELRLLRAENKMLRDSIDNSSVEIASILELRVSMNTFFEKEQRCIEDHVSRMEKDTQIICERLVETAQVESDMLCQEMRRSLDEVYSQYRSAQSMTEEIETLRNRLEDAEAKASRWERNAKILSRKPEQLSSTAESSSEGEVQRLQEELAVANGRVEKLDKIVANLRVQLNAAKRGRENDKEPLSVLDSDIHSRDGRGKSAASVPVGVLGQQGSRGASSQERQVSAATASSSARGGQPPRARSLSGVDRGSSRASVRRRGASEGAASDLDRETEELIRMRVAHAVRDLTASLERSHTEMKLLSEEKRLLEEVRSQLKAALAERERELASLQQPTPAAAAAPAATASVVSCTPSTCEAAADAALFASRFSDLSAQNEALQHRVSSLEEQLRHVDGSHQNLVEVLATTEERCRTLQLQLDARPVLQTVVDDTSGFAAQVRTLAEEAAELRGDLANVRANEKRLRTELHDLESSVSAKVTEAYDRGRADGEQYAVQLVRAEAMGEIRLLRKEASSRGKQLMKAKIDLGVANQELDRLSAELAALQPSHKPLALRPRPAESVVGTEVSFDGGSDVGERLLHAPSSSRRVLADHRLAPQQDAQSNLHLSHLSESRSPAPKIVKNSPLPPRPLDPLLKSPSQPSRRAERRDSDTLPVQRVDAASLSAEPPKVLKGALLSPSERQLYEPSASVVNPLFAGVQLIAAVGSVKVDSAAPSAVATPSRAGTPTRITDRQSGAHSARADDEVLHFALTAQVPPAPASDFSPPASRRGSLGVSEAPVRGDPPVEEGSRRSQGATRLDAPSETSSLRLSQTAAVPPPTESLAADSQARPAPSQRSASVASQRPPLYAQAVKKVDSWGHEEAEEKPKKAYSDANARRELANRIASNSSMLGFPSMVHNIPPSRPSSQRAASLPPPEQSTSQPTPPGSRSASPGRSLKPGLQLPEGRDPCSNSLKRPSNGTFVLHQQHALSSSQVVLQTIGDHSSTQSARQLSSSSKAPLALSTLSLPTVPTTVHKSPSRGLYVRSPRGPPRPPLAESGKRQIDNSGERGLVSRGDNPTAVGTLAGLSIEERAAAWAAAAGQLSPTSSSGGRENMAETVELLSFLANSTD